MYEPFRWVKRRSDRSPAAGAHTPSGRLGRRARVAPECQFHAGPAAGVRSSAGSGDARQRDKSARLGFTSRDRSKRALAWLSRQQKADGSYNAPSTAQPAATSLAVMAYISKGHLPGEGPYGRQLDAAIDYVLNASNRAVFSLPQEPARLRLLTCSSSNRQPLRRAPRPVRRRTTITAFPD
jgi:hypothetical protein